MIVVKIEIVDVVLDAALAADLAVDFPELRAFDAGLRGEVHRCRTKGELAEWFAGFAYSAQRARLGVP